MDLLREIEQLKLTAEWYRGWAQVECSEADRDARLGLAEHFEQKARALKEGLSPRTG
jgi:hypothetical protein